MAGRMMRRFDGGLYTDEVRPFPREVGRWWCFALFALEALWFGPDER